MGSALTGLVLAGGRSHRMGRDKALLELDGTPLLKIVIERLSSICREVLIVGGDPDAYAGFDVEVVGDVIPDVGVLGGLHAGLQAATYEVSLAVACDMPFIDTGLLLAFADWIEGHDVALLRQGEQVEPLHAAYRRTCLKPMEEMVHSGERRVVSFFPLVSVHYVTLEEIAPFDPQMRSFRNINTEEEWQAAREEFSAG